MLSKMARVCRRFLKFSGCATNKEDFKKKISLPLTEVIEKKASDKECVIVILNVGEDVCLKMYLIYEAVTGRDRWRIAP